MQIKNKTKFFIVILVLIIAIGVISIITIFSNRETSNDVSLKNDYEENQDDENFDSNITSQEINIEEIVQQENNLSEEEKKEIDEIKANFGISGNAELYEIQNDNNIEIPVIKSSIKYKVAFSGMIKNTEPDISKIDEIIKESHPKNAGIWIEEKSRDKFLKLIENNTNSTYTIDKLGYLRIKNIENPNENDNKLENAINGNKFYAFSVSSTCYIIDDVTGEVLDYCFENLDKYQIYEYFYDNDKYVIFINENKNKQLPENEIFESLVNLISL